MTDGTSAAVIVDYATPDGKKKRRPTLILILGIILFLGLAFAIFLPSLCRSGETANRVKCASNLRQIGQAILMYANEHQGQYPDSFGAILVNEDITAEVFVCPSSNDEKAEGKTPRDVADAMEKPASSGTAGHLSYVYLGRGLTSATVKDDFVIAYEPLMDHSGDGMNVLLGDGHVEFFTAKDTAKLLADVKVGKRPATMR